MLYKTHVFLENRKCQISMTETRFSTIRDPVLFLQFIKCYGLDINAWDRVFLAKNVMKNHILKPPTFTLIMLLSIQPVKIPEKITVFLIILVESSIFSAGRAKMPKNGVLIQ